MHLRQITCLVIAIAGKAGNTVGEESSMPHSVRNSGATPQCSRALPHIVFADTSTFAIKNSARALFGTKANARCR